MKNKLIKISLVILAVALIAGGVFMTVEMSVVGSEAQSIENQESKLAQANRELKNVLVDASALSFLEKNADSLGFSKAENVLYISGKEVFVAKLP